MTKHDARPFKPADLRRAEIIVAIMALSLSDLSAHAGDQAALDFLAEAAEAVRRQPITG